MGLRKSRFIKNSSIGFWVIVFIYCIKILSSSLYGLYFSSSAQIENADTWNYFIESRAETDWLLSNPKAFVADLFTNHYSQTGGFFLGTQSYWNDLKATFFIKILAVLNVFSCKNYYINLLFFNAAFMLGGVAFYRLFNENFIIKKWLLVTFVFFAPSFLFWGSGIHKDGIIFTTTAVVFYTFHSLLTNNVKLYKLFVLLVCLAVIFLLRNYYLLAILPALLAWLITYKFKRNAKMVFGFTIACCLLLFFCSGSINLISGISNSIVEKHNEFQTLVGNTKFTTPSLQANTISLISYFPYAMQYALLKPFPVDARFAKEAFVITENYFYLLVVLGAIIVGIKRKNEIVASPIILAAITTTFFLMVFIGYTVCFDAAIVRYRSVSLPLLMVPCLLIIFGKFKTQHPLV